MELIKLKTKRENFSSESSLLIKNTFIRACEQLDTSIFEPFIDEDQYFEEKDKYQFLHEMKDQFDYLKGKGVKEVKLVIGKCTMCFKGERVHEFYERPNEGKPCFAYNIQERNGRIVDIFRCNMSSGYERDARANTDPNMTYIYYK